MVIPLATGAEGEGIMALLEAIQDRTGLDFRGYAPASLRRRVRRQATLEGVADARELRDRALADPLVLRRIIAGLTVHVSGMFRDPGFFRAFRAQADRLRTYPFLRFWIAGCSTGEEAYSLAILLHEEGLHDRSRIYATDISATVLDRARAAVYPLSAMREHTRNYQRAGGAASFADYYTADDENAMIRPFLRTNVIFAAHNLATDASFNEFHGIFCRNVMIYFNRELQARVHRLLHGSLLQWGYLGLGRSETLRFSGFEQLYEPISAKERLFRRVA